MKYEFFTCDVFTPVRFGGNQLAVLPEAEGLSGSQMQQIAREFNYAETTFVFQAEQGNTRKVRIFTPSREVPFAGHPNIGTAFVLSSVPAYPDIEPGMTVVFEEQAGLVAVRIEASNDGRPWCELTAPQGLELGDAVEPEFAASVLSLEPGDILSGVHQPRAAGVGLPFLIVELKNRTALTDAAFDLPRMRELVSMGLPPDVLLYIRSSGDFDIRARMFAPLDGVPEDPATGSANCALAALLSHCDSRDDADFAWRISQGVEMGRPSVLNVRTQKRGGAVIATMIGGECVMVSEGLIEVE